MEVIEGELAVVMNLTRSTKNKYEPDTVHNSTAVQWCEQ